MKTTTWATMIVLATFTSAATVQAQDEDEELETESGEADDIDDTGEELTDEGDDVAGEEPPAAATEEADTGAAASVVEEPGKTYQFVGARYRGIIVPKFMMNLFADGGDTVYVHAFGPEFAIRKDGFEYNLSAWLGLYHMDPTAFKGKDDEEIAWELVESNLNILFLSSDFLWSHSFTPELALNYGAGVGLGIVFGDLRRNQIYPGPDSNVDDPNTWERCVGVGNPDAAYCDNDNDHYGDFTEPSWANGGSKPIVFPWLALQTGLRYKAHPKFVGRLDVGFGTSGFFFGLGADYGI